MSCEAMRSSSQEWVSEAYWVRSIRACGSDAEIATFKNNTWSGGGTLTVADGREFLITTNVWQTKLEIQTAA
jgi:hypothetical protein